MMKRTISMLAAAAFLSVGAGISSVYAAPVPADGTVYTLHVEGKEDKQIDTVLMVPLREVAEQLGFKVTWEKGKTLVDNGIMHTTVTVGEDSYVVSTSKKDLVGTSAPFSLGIPPTLKNGVTYVPVTLFRPLLGNDAAVIEVSGQTLTIFPKAPVGETETTAPAADETAKDADMTGSAQIPNPFTDYTTLSDAEADAGFTLSLPQTDTAYETSYRAIKGKLLEVIYSENGTESMRIRKGSDAGDVSGDYSTYPTVKTIIVDGINVRMKGNGNRMSLATWEDGGYSYSIHVDRAVTIADMMGMVRDVK